MRAAMKMTWWAGVLALALTSGCAEVERDAPASEQPESQAATTTRAAALVDPDGHNWVAVGSTGSELVGPDGTPDVPSARQVGEGALLSAGVSLASGWVLLDSNGKLSYLDDEGKPLRADLRTMFNGTSPTIAVEGMIASANGPREGALVGSVDGQVQFVDEFGEPVGVPKAVFTDGSAVRAAGYHAGTDSWLVGDAKGQLLAVSQDLTTLSASAPFAARADVGSIVGNPDSNDAKHWLAASGDEATYYPNPVPITLGSGSSVASIGQRVGTGINSVALGTADGRVAVAEFSGVSAGLTWREVFDGGAAVAGVLGGESGWLAWSDDGRVRLLGADGTPDGAASSVTPGGSAITDVRVVDGGWLVATASAQAIKINAQLKAAVSITDVLEGAEAFDAVSTDSGVLVVGEQGKYRLLGPDGAASGAVQTLAGAGTLRAASWSGSVFLVAGDDGFAQLLSADGTPQGDALTLLDGGTIEFASWNGVFWLIGGEEGKVQRVRADGTTAGNVTKLAGFDHAHDARWSSFDWMVVGDQGGSGVVQLLKSDGSAITEATTIIGSTGPLYAVDYNGREWLAGGADGLVQIISAQGIPRTEPTPMPRDVLNGQPIHDIDFNGQYYIVGGGNGLVRVLRENLLSPGQPVSTLGFGTVRALAWTRPRGFAGGLCLTRDNCYQGVCIGSSVLDGFCCSAACDGPCESCFKVDTGVTDGTCAPVTSGRMPVSEGCAAQDASTCGNTGLCDGAGGCQQFDASTACGQPTCSNGEVTSGGSCDGMGMCGAGVQKTSCAPYAGCDGDACPTSCAADTDCVEGYTCQDQACVMGTVTPPTPDNGGDDGCCATVRPRQEPNGLALVLLAGAALGWRRRRQRGGRA